MFTFSETNHLTSQMFYSELRPASDELLIKALRTILEFEFEAHQNDHRACVRCLEENIDDSGIIKMILASSSEDYREDDQPH